VVIQELLWQRYNNISFIIIVITRQNEICDREGNFVSGIFRSRGERGELRARKIRSKIPTNQRNERENADIIKKKGTPRGERREAE